MAGLVADMTCLALLVELNADLDCRLGGHWCYRIGTAVATRANAGSVAATSSSESRLSTMSFRSTIRDSSVVGYAIPVGPKTPNL